MNMTILEKIKTLISYTFSSFLSIELLLFCILLFIVLLVNIKKKEKIVTYSVIGIYLGILIGTMVAYSEYVLLCIKAFFKLIVTYVCFPTTVALFTTIVFITVIMIYTLFTKKLTKFKKILNYAVFTILYFFFMSFIVITTYNDIDLSSLVELYSNDYVLVLAQSSNFLLLVWFIFTFYYRLYIYLKKRFD